MKIKKLNKEVLFCSGGNIELDRHNIADFKKRSILNKRKRIRLCAHESIKDKLHEMFIVHTKNTYVRPHKHLKKSESLHIIEGLADLVLFNEKGKIVNVIELGSYLSGNKFYYRISVTVFHMLIIRSKFIVFHEATSGPFRKSATIPAKWSPEENEVKSVKKFISMISKKTERWNG